LPANSWRALLRCKQRGMGDGETIDTIEAMCRQARMRTYQQPQVEMVEIAARHAQIDAAKDALRAQRSESHEGFELGSGAQPTPDEVIARSRQSILSSG
jgi:hypothetical protein